MQRELTSTVFYLLLIPSMRARVDIVIPVYDGGAVLERALRSVYTQTYQCWILTVVDDGSTNENVRRTVDEFAHPRLRYIRQDNAGPGAARNTGLRTGQCELVAFLDADDEWEPAYLEASVNALDAHPDSTAAVARWYWVVDGVSIPPKDMGRPASAEVWRCPAHTSPEGLKQAVDSMHSSAVVARRSRVESAGGFYDADGCDYGEDAFLWLQLVLRDSIVRLSEPLLRFHTDHSQLGFGRTEPFPVPPLLKRWDIVLQRTPDSHTQLLARYLHWYAVWFGRRASAQGDGRRAREALKHVRGVPVYRGSRTRRWAAFLRSYVVPMMRQNRLAQARFRLRC